VTVVGTGRVVIFCSGDPRVKSQDVGALGKLHDDGIFRGSVATVVLGQFRSEAARLNADHGVQLGVKAVLPAENFRGDLVLLEGGTGMIEGVQGNVTEKFAQGLGAVQNRTIHQSLDFGLDEDAIQRL
jgi:hypothetical protein